jgi:hypothetical protein
LILQDVFDKLKLVDETHTILFRPPEKTNIRLTVELIKAHFGPAAQEWAELVSATNKDLGDLRGESIIFPSEDLAEWNVSRISASDNISLWLREGEFGMPDAPQDSDPIFDYATVDQFLCSSCGNPGTNLELCGRCGKTKYCDPLWCVAAWYLGPRLVL